MSERTSITQVCQIGVESVPGTGVAATKRLASVMIKPSIQAEVQKYRAAGYKYPTVAALGKAWTKASYEGALTYTELVYFLSSIMKKVTPTIEGDGPAYSWIFAPATTVEDVVASFTTEYGSAVRAGKFTYGLVNGFGYSINRNEAKISGDMIGQLYTDGITLSSSGVTEVDLVPVLPAQVNVYLDTSAAGLGTTKLTRVLSVDYQVSDRFGTAWTLDRANTSWAAAVETEPKAEMKLKVEADAAGMALLATINNGDSRFMRVEALGGEIETGVNYTFIHDLCGKVTGIGEFGDDDGLTSIEFTLSQMHDATWGKSTEFEVVNTLSAL